MSLHPLGVLSAQGEKGVKSAEYLALFAPDATLYSPFLIKPVADKELTVRFLNEVFARVGYPKYSEQFTDDQNTTILLWNGEVQGPDGRLFAIEGSIAITEGEDGLIHEVKSYLRPLQVVFLLKDALIPSAASVLPREYWDASPRVNS